MTANASAGPGKVFSNAVILTGVVVMIAMVAALQSDTQAGAKWMAWSWYIAGPFCFVLLILAVVLVVKNAIFRALVVLLLFLPAVPLAVVGLPIYRINQALQANAKKIGVPRPAAESVASVESRQSRAEIRAAEAQAQKEREERAAAQEVAKIALQKERQRLEALLPAAQAAMEGKTFAEIEKTHGKALSRDPITGWATWPKFKARFVNGKVLDVDLP